MNDTTPRTMYASDTDNQSVEKFRSLEQELNEIVLERHDEVRGTLLGLLSDTHVFLLGPPGTAKSYLLESLCKRITGAQIFSRLMTKYSVPEEMFGPVKLSALQQDRYERKIENHLPTAHFAFIDEVWKANSSILNSLLKILNERKYDNDETLVDCPLLLALFASNETPTDRELDALYDRIPLRFLSDDLQDNTSFSAVISGETRNPDDIVATVSLKDVMDARDEVAALDMSDDVKLLIRGIDLRASHNGMRVSTRRHRQVVAAVKAHAWLEGRSEVSKMDLLLPYSATVWKTATDVEPARETVEGLVAPVYKQAKDALKVVRVGKREFDEARAGWNASAASDAAKAVSKVGKVITTFDSLLDEASDDEKPLVARVKDEARAVHRHMAESMA